MKNIFFFLVLLLSTNKAFAQSDLEATVRLSIHNFRMSDGSGGLTESNITELMSYLEQFFGPWGIHFCVKSIDYIDDDFIYGSSAATVMTYSHPLYGDIVNETFYDHFVVQNGANLNETLNIDLYTRAVFNPISYGAGETNGHDCLSSCQVVNGMVTQAGAAVVAHELGHCLGLQHTFSGSLQQFGSCVSELGQALDPLTIDCCGDEICDTPFDPGLNAIGPYEQVSETCEWKLQMGNPYIFNTLGIASPLDDISTISLTWTPIQFSLYDAFIASFITLDPLVQYTPLLDNIMSYTFPPCRSSFTQGQADRMWNVLPSIQVAYFTSVNQIVELNLVVPSNTTMELPSSDLYVFESVTLEENSTLILNDTRLEFSSDGILVVKHGANLIATNTIFTSRTECSDTQSWKRIEVWGPREIDGTVLSSGSIHLVNCTISNASTGIFGGYDYTNNAYSDYSPIVSCNNVIFTNNYYDVRLTCQSPSCLRGAGGTEQRFSGCQFRIRENYPNSLVEKQHGYFMNLNNTDNVTIEGCSFTNEVPIETHGTNCSIYSLNSFLDIIPGEYDHSLNIDDFSNSIIVSSLPCQINSINIDQTLVYAFPNIEETDNTTFNNIYLSGVVNPTIVNSMISFGYLGYGLYLMGCTDYNVRDNVFFDANANELSYGIVVRGSGPAANLIDNNQFGFDDPLFPEGSLSFTGLNTSILSLDNNAWLDFDNTGLQLHCNDFVYGERMILVSHSEYYPSNLPSGMSTTQGSEFVGAGNWFEPSTVSDFENFEENDVDYRYKEIDPADILFLIPDNNVTGVISNESLFPSNCQSTLEGITDGDIQEEIENMKDILVDHMSALTDILDGGNTDELVDEIIYADYSDAVQLAYDLLSRSPYLSESALKEAIANIYALPNALLLLILQSNPHVSRTGDLRDKVNTRLIPFTEYELALINQARGVITAKDNHEANIAYLNVERNRRINELMRRYLGSGNTQSSINLVALEPALNYRYQHAMLLYATGNRSGAEAILSAIDVNHMETGFQAMHGANVQAMVLLMTIKDNHMQATPNELQQLRDLVAGPHAQSAAWAASLLRCFEEVPFDVVYEDPNAQPRSSWAQLPVVKEELLLYPNPVDNLLLIQPIGGPTDSKYLVEITDMLGKVVYLQDHSPSKQLLVDLSELASGMYTCHVRSGSFQQSASVVVRH
jgi:hypothetical protein